MIIIIHQKAYTLVISCKIQTRYHYHREICRSKMLNENIFRLFICVKLSMFMYARYNIYIYTLHKYVVLLNIAYNVLSFIKILSNCTCLMLMYSDLFKIYFNVCNEQTIMFKTTICDIHIQCGLNCSCLIFKAWIFSRLE